MFLKKIHFFEFKDTPNYWEIKDVVFGKINIVVGLNATGKTRLCSVTSNIAKHITKKSKLLNGYWSLSFIANDESKFDYELEIKDKKVESEKIVQNGKVCLDRRGEEGKLYSVSSKGMIDIFPPATELTLSVRRDKKEYPFLEELYEWADNFYGFKFTNASPNQVTIPNPNVPGSELENLGTVPYLLVEAMKTPGVVEEIIKDFTSVGYPIEAINVLQKMATGQPINIHLVQVQEKDLKCPTQQSSMSQGMYRALSLVVILEYILKKNIICTILVDDLGEGLDYDRANKIMRLLMDKVKDSNIQLIVTSNQNYLVNEANFEYLNFLERVGHEVRSYNYENSKKKFEEFKMSGLSNFDFLIKKFYKAN